jgi:predicted porin
MNKKLLTAVVGATLAVAGNAANAIDLKISGHLARGVMWGDDGISSETYHVDMTTSPSRFRLLASDDLMPGIKAGVNWEMGFNSNQSSVVTNTQAGKSSPSGANTGLLSERQQEVWFSGAFGRVGFGQGDSATKDLISIDLSGTTLAAGGAPADIGGGLSFRAPQGSGAGAITTISAVLNNFDGNRYDRIRYDSPALGPVVLSASTGYTNVTGVDTVEFAARLNMDMGGGGKLAGGIGFVRAHNSGGGQASTEANGVQEDTQFSLSWLAPFGLNVTVAHSMRENDGTLDADFTRFQVGYIAGEHAIAVGMAIGNDQALTDDEAEQIYVSYNFKPKPWADLFASVKTVSLDRTGVEAEDILVVLVGTRITF